MRFGFYSRNDQISEKLQKNLHEILEKKGFVFDSENPEVVIFIGGDGTFLRAVHEHLEAIDQIAFVGVRSGTLGFFCDYGSDEIETLAADLFQQKVRSSFHPLLEATLNFDSKTTHIFAVNEVRLENPFRTMVCEVRINNEKLEHFRGNGLIVSSNLGSSAYNKSLGGALVDPLLETLQLTEIATIQNNVYHSLGSSIVLASNRVVSFTGDLNRTVVGYDHVFLEAGETLHSVDIRLSKKTVQILHKPNHSYVDLLHKTFVVD